MRTHPRLLFPPLVAILLLSGLLASGCRALAIPGSAEAGVTFSTAQATGPRDARCLNSGGESAAHELINLRERIVVIGGGSNPIPDAEWPAFTPRLPWRKNINRNLQFRDSCFYRSPDSPADCTGAACQIERTYRGYTWIDLTRVDAIDCYPTPDAGCNDDGSVEAGAFALSITRKCHRLVFSDSAYVLTDERGQQYVMHATERPTPTADDPALVLPADWTLQQVSLATPLTLLPFGGGDNCYHLVGRDNLGQGYHQFTFAGATYP